jgi:hypothetical protein
MTVTRAQFLSLLEPKLRSVKNDQDFQRRPTIYTNFYGEIIQSKKATETEYERAGIGDFQVKAEGGAVTYTDPIDGSELASTHVRRSDGYKITQEMIDHDQYAEMVKMERDLQIAGDEDLEIAGHLLLNNAFGTTNNAAYGFTATGFDGLGLCSTAHTRLDGGATQANRPSTDADLSWSSLADGLIQFELWVDHRGRRIREQPVRVVIHPNDRLTLRELLGSALKPGTANNELNALNGELSMENAIVTPYITSTDDWFIFGANPQTVWYWDVQPRTAMKDDFDLEIIKRKRVHGFSMLHTRWHGIYGTNGA